MWTDPENSAISALTADGFGRPDAMVLTAMVSRRYARGKSKLIDVLSGHIGLEDMNEVTHVIERLMLSLLLVHVTYGEQQLIAISVDYGQQLRSSGRAAGAIALESLMMTPVRRFESVGPMTDPVVLSSFLQAVSGAQRIIRLPFFSSPSNIEGIDVLEQRCRAGVQLRVLIGSPKAITELRGPSHTNRAVRAVESWTARTRGLPNAEVRVVRDSQDAEYGSSMSIDGRVLRFDVHEPLAERSLAGEMLVVHETGGNLVRLFDKYFDEIWDRSLPVSGWARHRRQLVNWKWTLATLALVATCLLLPNEVERELVVGATVTAFFAALDENSERIRNFWRRITHA